MPIHPVYRKGKKYYRWGQHGHLYPTRAGALAQARAAFAHGYRGRARPRQHVRRLRRGRQTMVNLGVRQSYGLGPTWWQRRPYSPWANQKTAEEVLAEADDSPLFQRAQEISRELPPSPHAPTLDDVRSATSAAAKGIDAIHRRLGPERIWTHVSLSGDERALLDNVGIEVRDDMTPRELREMLPAVADELRRRRRSMKSYGSWLFREQVKQRIQGDAGDERNLKKLVHYLEKRPELLEQIGQTPIHVFGPKKVELQFNPFQPNDIYARVQKGRGVQGVYFPKGTDGPHGLLGISTSNITGDIYTQPKLFGEIPLRGERWSPSAGYKNIEGLFSLGGTLKHELQHKKQDQEGRLLAPTANKYYQKYWNNPLEVEARKAEFLNPDERRVQAIDTPAKIEAGMRGVFG